MSKTYELLSESLKEIIDDMKKTGGKNLTRRVVEKPTPQEINAEKIVRSQYQSTAENFESARGI